MMARYRVAVERNRGLHDPARAALAVYTGPPAPQRHHLRLCLFTRGKQVAASQPPKQIVKAPTSQTQTPERA